MEKIVDILRDLEKTNEIRIVFAVEAGSRAWGFESDDSDYDIRFIYVHKNRNKYISLKAHNETIDGFSEDRVYDWQGWDITKCLKLIEKVNPTIAEWLYSPIIYHKDEHFEKYLNEMKYLLTEQKRICPLLNHYKSMAKSNYKTHIKGKEEVIIKKYLYAIRPIAMFQWLLNRSIDANNFIHVNFILVLDELKPCLQKDVYEKIIEIIELKKKCNEVNIIRRIDCVDEWIEDQLENNTIQEIEKNESLIQKVISNDDFDKLLHNILGVEFR